jgi:tetratricopeptide (TPR) repeat protein
MPLAYSQGYKGKGRVKGVVTDGEGNPIDDVTVKLYCLNVKAGFETKTNKKGEWKGNWIRSGMWHIDFMKIGYEPKKISLRIKELSRNPDIEVVMKKIEGLALTEDIVSKMGKANDLFNQEKYEEAIAAYKKILADNPDAFIVNQNVGNAYFALQDYDKAIEFYEKALVENENNSSLHISIGNAFINKKEDEKAMEWYGKVNVEEVEDVVALYNMGVLFFNSGQGQKAIPCFRRAVELDDQYTDSYYQLGMSYLQSGMNAEAIEIFEKFLELEPDSDRASTARSIIDTLKKQDS